MGGVGLFHVIPDDAIADPDRYRGTVEDETRLLLRRGDPRAEVPLRDVRAGRDNQLYSERGRTFFDHCAAQQWVSTETPASEQTRRGSSRTPVHETPQVTLSFSELKYLFECPYQFKLRFLYGFNPPLHEALGYGKGLHDALSEIHKRALDGDIVTKAAAEDLVDRHLHAPFAYPDAARRRCRRAAIKAIERYFDAHGRRRSTRTSTARSRSRSTSRRASPSTAAST